MRKLFLAVSFNLLAVAIAHAQNPMGRTSTGHSPMGPTTGHVSPASHESQFVSSGELTPTPEMWFYEQERRRWDDPQILVRTAAEQRAADRHARMAAMAWYGMSNSRPTVSPDPIDNPFAPHWRSNGYQPAEWVGATSHSTILLEANRGTRAF
jgi:hypothetical protein